MISNPWAARYALLLLLPLCLAIAGCGGHQASAKPSSATQPTTQPTTQPAPMPAAQGTFDRPDLGVKLTWPAGWESHPDADYALLLLPANARGGAEATSISLDVPKLPPHIRGLIPIGSVRNGYLDDLRKSVGKLDTKDLPTPGVPGAAQRLVRSTWKDASGTAQQETALLLVHDDGVYILRGRSPVAEEQATRAAFDQIVRSLEWAKRASSPASQPTR